MACGVCVCMYVCERENESVRVCVMYTLQTKPKSCVVNHSAMECAMKGHKYGATSGN